MNRQTATQTNQATKITPLLASGILQRKCDCGQHTIAGGKCDGCGQKQLSLQRATRNSQLGSRGSQLEAGNSAGVPSIVHEVLRSSGQPLETATRAFFEPRFGQDFSRVHARAKAGMTKPIPAQAKLKISQPGDAYEQEADRVADYVIRSSMPQRTRNNALQMSASSPYTQLQRSSEVEDESLLDDDEGRDMDEVMESEADVVMGAEDAPGEEGPLKLSEYPRVDVAMPKREEAGTMSSESVRVPGGEGRPLDESALAFMEKRFHYSFAHVRVHTGRDAADSASRLGAQAYTIGRHIYFGDGYYRPENNTGRRLLAHELTHVVQQSGATEIVQMQRGGGRGPAQGGRQLPPRPPRRRIVVDLARQTAFAMTGEQVVRRMPVSTGISAHPTHPGHFRIGERDPDHTSSEYGRCIGPQGSRGVGHGVSDCRTGEHYVGAPMNFFQRFNGQEGFHQGSLPGHPDSHGCVHLSRRDAAWLFGWASVGTTVDVVASTRRRPPRPGQTQHPGQSPRPARQPRGAR